MVKIGIVGHFGFGKNLTNGQTIKTKILAKELEAQLGKENVQCVDTHMSKTQLLKLPFVLWNVLKHCQNVVILPAHNGIKIISPLLFLANIFFKRQLHYVVIGGWLPSLLEKYMWLTQILKKYSGIYVETNTMKNKLERQGFKNIVILPNCKELNILSENELSKYDVEPYALCTFSRVEEKKGISDAVEAVSEVNKYFGRTVYTLDIYGPIDSGQEEWFNDLQERFPNYVSYKGIIEFDKSVEVLQKYFMLLFPTRYYTEGIPGTIIDAYAAGLPVISSRWESFDDIVEDGKTGMGYEFGNFNDLKKVLLRPESLREYRTDWQKYCIRKSMEYVPETVIKQFLKNISSSS